MAINYDFMEKLDKDFTVATSYAKTVPKSRFKPDHGGILLFPEIYLNVKYTLPAGTADGLLKVYLMREDPEDSTLWGDLILQRGRTYAQDTKLGMKYWGDDDLGRYVHFEVRAYGTKTCYLNDSCYSAYGQVW
jgi:hypothetical protein